MRRGADHLQELSAPRSPVWDEDDSLAADESGANEVEEERLQAQRDMQMLDLGTGRREWLTTVDKPLPRELRQSKEELLRARKVNEQGTDAAKWYQQNKKALNAWNNISSEIASDHADREQLADLMGGQSHRARLNREIREQGGQNYGEWATPGIDDNSRHGRGGGVAGRRITGRSGRGAPTHVPNTMTNGRVPTTAILSPPTGPRAHRPLDPPIDPHREYGCKAKRGGRTFHMSYSKGQPLGRGDTPNDARATMEGSTVRIGPAVPTKAKSEGSDPPRAPRSAPVTVALNDQAFLRVMKGATSKPAFNKHVQEKSKPAPASKAAALVEQPAKTAKKPGSALAKSSETPAEAYRKMEARSLHKSPEVGVGKIRLAPTHEFAFPPPITRSGGKNIRGSDVSVHTDGVETAASFNSADFLTQSSGPPANSGESKQKDDLIALDQGSEPPKTGANASNEDPLAASNIHSGQSSGIPDIMDAELDVDIPQTSLTPESSVAPRSVIYRGARYVRADQLSSQDGEIRLQGTHPDVQIKSSDLSGPERVAVTNALRIGLQTLQGSSGESIPGDHNLLGQSQCGIEGSSTQALAASKWANEKVILAPLQIEDDKNSMWQPRSNPTSFQQPWRRDCDSFQNEERDDIETTDVPVSSSARQQDGPASNLAASKYATPNASVMTSQVELEKLATVPCCARSFATGRLQNGVSHPISAPRSTWYNIVKTPTMPDATRDAHPGTRSNTVSVQTDKVHRGADDSSIITPRQSEKAPGLAASKWGRAEAKVNGAQPKTKVGGKSGESCLFSASSENIVHTRGEAAEWKDGSHRQRNPFATIPLQSKFPRDDENNSLSRTNAVQPIEVPTMTERSGNIPAVPHTAPTMEERRAQLMSVGSQAEPFMFKFSAAASSNPSKPLDSKWPNDTAQDKANCSRTSRGKTRPIRTLMASKYTSNFAHSSFRKVRRSRPDSE